MIFSIEKRKRDAKAICTADSAAITYGELRAFMGQMGQVFHGRCLVFCMCENVPGAVAGYLGMLESGVVPLLLGTDLDMEQYAAFYHTYEPSYVWAPSDWADKMQEHIYGKVYEAYGYCLWQTGFQPCPMHDSLALLLATSGSTGSPKLVRLSRKNIESNAESIREYLNLDENERPVTTLPMQYTYGLSVINSHLLAGACILMTRESYVQSGFWKFLEEKRATSFGGVPYTYEILERMRIFTRPLPSLRSITQAGGKLPVALQKKVAAWAEAQDIRFFVMYGQTEATARMSYLPPENCLEKPGSIGIPIPGGKFSLMEENGEMICCPDVPGELVYAGENVSLGYAENKNDLRLGDENGGVLYTGDIAKRDADGYYYIVGRKKRFIKIFGVRVGLDACEEILRGHYEGVEFACSGSDNHLEIYGTDRQAVDQAAGYLAKYLKLNKKSFSAFYLPEIPKNDSGKIQYDRLRAGGDRRI